MNSSSIAETSALPSLGSGQGSFPPPALPGLGSEYEPIRHLRPPALALTGSPLAWNCRPPPRSQTSLVAHHSCSIAAIITQVESSLRHLARRRQRPSPLFWRVGSRWLFRGLLNVHSRCGPHGPLTPHGAFPIEVLPDHSSSPDPLRSWEREFHWPDSPERTFLRLDRTTAGEIMICSLKTGPFRIRVFRGIFPWLGGAEDDESITVFGCAKGVHSSAGS